MCRENTSLAPWALWATSLWTLYHIISFIPEGFTFLRGFNVSNPTSWKLENATGILTNSNWDRAASIKLTILVMDGVRGARRVGFTLSVNLGYNWLCHLLGFCKLVRVNTWALCGFSQTHYLPSRLKSYYLHMKPRVLVLAVLLSDGITNQRATNKWRLSLRGNPTLKTISQSDPSDGRLSHKACSKWPVANEYPINR